MTEVFLINYSNGEKETKTIREFDMYLSKEEVAEIKEYIREWIQSILLRTGWR